MMLIDRNPPKARYEYRCTCSHVWHKNTPDWLGCGKYHRYGEPYVRVIEKVIKK